MPKDANLSQRVVWEMVLKTALRSRTMKTDNCLESAAIRSLVILRRGVSVL